MLNLSIKICFLTTLLLGTTSATPGMIEIPFKRGVTERLFARDDNDDSGTEDPYAPMIEGQIDNGV